MDIHYRPGEPKIHGVVVAGIAEGRGNSVPALVITKKKPNARTSGSRNTRETTPKRPKRFASCFHKLKEA